MAEQICYAAIAYVLIKLGTTLLESKAKQPLVDEKPSTRSTRGTILPILQGRRRVAPTIAWVGNRIHATEGAAGGKGTSATAGGQDVYYESAWHNIVVGPTFKLFAITSNGEIVWSSSTGLDAINTPSGSFISLTPANEGGFYIYWGERSQAMSSLIANLPEMGFPSHFTFHCLIVWINRRLGGFPVWSTHEYELECRPVQQGQIDSGLPYSTNQADMRLKNSPDYYKNGIGPTGPLFNVVRANNADENTSPGPYIKIQGNHASAAGHFLPNNYALLAGQASIYLNKPFKILSSTYNAAENVFLLTGVWANLSGLQPLLTSWTVAPSTAPNGVAIHDYTVPPTLYDFWFGPVTPHKTFSPFGNVVNSDGMVRITSPQSTHMSTGAQRIVLYIKADTFRANCPAHKIRIGFRGVNPSNSSQFNDHYAELVPHNGMPELSNVNGVHASCSLHETFDNQGGFIADFWLRVEVRYTTGASGVGGNPSPSSWNRFVYIEVDGLHNSGSSASMPEFWVWDTPPVYLQQDNGNVVTGITTINFTEALNNADSQGGTVQEMLAGFGADGLNGAHVLHQFMFARWPHGAGLDPDRVNMASLEDVGIKLAAEGLRTHILVSDGDDFLAASAALMLELGIAMYTNPLTGLLEFKLIRAVDDSEIVHVPSAAILDPLPEVVTNLSPAYIWRALYGFLDRDFQYRDMPVTVYNDGAARNEGQQNTTSTPLLTATDFETAAKIAYRRQQEQLASIYTITLNRGGRLIAPGTVIEIDPKTGITERIRITEVQNSTTAPSAVLNGLTNIYDLGLPVVDTFPLVEGPSGGDEPPLDVGYRLLELPAVVSSGAIRVLPLRTRASQRVSGASVWLSRDDESYLFSGSQSNTCTGGTLDADWPLDTNYLIEDGPTYLSDDIDGFSFNPISDAAWLSGARWLVINDEICYVRDVRPLDNSRFQIFGIVRACLGTRRQDHPLGSRIFIYRLHPQDPVNSTLFSVGATLYAKLTPRIGGSVKSLATTPAISTVLDGRAIRPLPISNLRTLHLNSCYETGEDVILSWCYQHPDSLINRTGAGLQAFGEVCGQTDLPPNSFKINIRDGSTIVSSYQVSDPTTTISNATIVTLLGSQRSFSVDVVLQWNGLRSTGATINITKI